MPAEAVEALRRLCAHYGIAADYHDIWGTRHTVAPAHLWALLREFGVTPQQSGDDPAASWRRTLPPVLLLDAGAPSFDVPLRLPRAVAHLTWRIECENGTVQQGEAETAQLHPSEHAEIDGEARVLYRLPIALPLALGYHRLRIDGCPGESLLVCAPAQCYRPPALENDGRLWGLTLQLHSLRSQRNWGIGDFTDLAALAAQAAREGAGLIGLNPLHALFPHNPAHASPYSPSSRAQLNVLYLDVEAIPDFRDCPAAQQRVRSPAFQARLAALREAALVEHAEVAAAKLEVLELLYQHFRERERADEGLRQFRAERGAALREHAVFEALQEHLHRGDAQIWGWPAWPAAYRDPAGEAVAAFARQHAERVGFFEYLQWQAARQLDAVVRQCRALGMPIGLYLDLAVSVDRGGSDAWRHQACFALDASVGAPPDEFNPNGQNWGLPPLRPDRLRDTGYQAFIEVLRANMRGAGAIRIDHVMGLMRLFWIPAGGTARGGAYVHYPLDEMLAIVALESERNRCLVIGEDLGTVADEMRAALRRFGVLSYRLLYFEHGADGVFRPPAEYPRDAVVAVSTHDLATLAGWWSVHDLRLRLALGLFPNEAVFEKQLLDRAQQRIHLLSAVQHATELPADVLGDAVAATDLPTQAVLALHAFLAATPSKLMVLQLEDALGETEQANMPGTTTLHPNWRRKYTRRLEEFWALDAVQGLCRGLARIRPRASTPEQRAPADETLVPRATYRLQFHAGFTFDDATAILPYLARLGISHVYCSPIQRARPGSMHGYDVVAHDEINPELGGLPAFERFTQALKANGMGQLLDLVPNHMGVLGADNPWWMDVLENGAASLYAQHFDIEWEPLNAELVGKVLVPVLGDHYGDVLDRGELQLRWDGTRGELALHYHAHRFPLAPQTYPAVLDRVEGQVADADVAASLASIATALRQLPRPDAASAQALMERARDKELLKARLGRLAAKQPAVAQGIAFAVDALNQPAAGDALHQLLEAQAWRLAYWRVAADEINYRRFFDINELAALRIEREAVFEATHALALDLIARGWADGLRIDHPDGLYDPARYFERLQQGFAQRTGLPWGGPGADGRPHRPLYVVAEKIAAPHEEVPESWAVHGTTGYRFANVANGVLVDHRAADRLRRIWHAFTGTTGDFEEAAYHGKRAVARGALASELTVQATELLRIARSHRRTRDYTLNTLRLVLSEVVACLAVYRTYITDEPSAQDVHYIDLAIRAARRRSQAADPSVFAFVREALLGRTVPGAPPEARARALRFATRFQQFSAPVAAKGVEDTAFYRYFPLASLNEVGGDPDGFGMTVAQFHEASADRARRWPHTMLATSTHDNKRSEDVRLRIDVLSEMTARWRLALRRWRALNQDLHAAAQDAQTVGPPSAAHEYLFYQTVLGTLAPDATSAEAHAGYIERIVHYMRKAAREGKAETSWTLPHEDYEQALEGFVREALAPRESNRFLAELRQFAATLRWYGALNSFTLVLLKYTSPGVPDLYQGNELIDDSLVDPDNRRPVDYTLRAQWLDALAALASGAPQDLGARVAQLAATPEDGRAKLWLSWRLLSLRRELPRLFRDGGYTPLEVRGPCARHVVAYLRQHPDGCVIVVAVRLFATLDASANRSATEPSSAGGAMRLPTGAAVWRDTTVLLPQDLAPRTFEDRLTGAPHTARNGRFALAELFQHFPGAVLVAAASEH